MAFTDFIIDIVRNGTTLQQKINVEQDAVDTAKIAPARVLQLNGKPLANNNRLPVESLIKTATNNPIQYSTIGTANAGVIKNSSGVVYSLSCINLNLNVRYLQLFNRATVPTSNSIPLEIFAVYGNIGQLVLGQDYFTINGLDFSTGIVWGMSTAPLTYLAATATETIFTVRYL